MENYSIESEIDHIYDQRTRIYFQEVFSSYNNGNYRSAIVMLWSVVVCDLVYKLQHLRDIESDTISDSILQSIEIKQKNNPKSPDWEIELLKQVKEKTELLDVAEYQSLLYLQETRHLSAHPVLSASDLLFSPNKDTARALIRCALDSVLLKPPILTKKIVEAMVIDLATKRDVLIDDISLKRYLEARYFRSLRFATETHLFRALWKFVFRIVNDDTDKNRDINFRALKVIFAHNAPEFRKYIEGHKDYFSDIGSGESLDYLMRFLCENSAVYYLLNDSVKVLIQNLAVSDLNKFAQTYFLSPTVEDHLSQVLQRIVAERRVSTSDNTLIRKTTILPLNEIAVDRGCQSLVLEIAIQSYVKSANFNSADIACNELVLPLLNSMNAQQMHNLLSGIELNDQTYIRKQAKTDHKVIKEHCDLISAGKFEYSLFPHFLESAGR